MPRYLIERTFPNGLGVAPNQQGCQAANTVIETNAQQGVTLVHSYVAPDKKHTFCIYDAPSPEAIRKWPCSWVALNSKFHTQNSTLHT